MWTNAFARGEERVRTRSRTRSHAESNAFKTRARYTLDLIGTVHVVTLVENDSAKKKQRLVRENTEITF